VGQRYQELLNDEFTVVHAEFNVVVNLSPNRPIRYHQLLLGHQFVLEHVLVADVLLNEGEVFQLRVDQKW